VIRNEIPLDVAFLDAAVGLGIVKAAVGELLPTASSSPHAILVYGGGPALMEPDFGSGE